MELRQDSTGDSVEVSSELHIVDRMVMAFHPFRFDITECLFLLNIENVRRRPNSQRW
jgi:hypothetical protein